MSSSTQRTIFRPAFENAQEVYDRRQVLARVTSIFLKVCGPLSGIVIRLACSNLASTQIPLVAAAIYEDEKFDFAVQRKGLLWRHGRARASMTDIRDGTAHKVGKLFSQQESFLQLATDSGP